MLSQPERVLAKAAELKDLKVSITAPKLNRIAKALFDKISKLDFPKLEGEPDKIAVNLMA